MYPPKNSNISITPSPQLLQSLKSIKLFLELFPPVHLEEDIWKFAFSFVNSKEEGEWTHIDRTNIFFIYNQLINLSRALIVINNELGSLHTES